MKTLIRWNPNNIFSEMDRLMETAVAPTTRQSYLHIALDVAEKDDIYTITASVPGLTANDIEVTLEDNTLTIKGEYNQNETQEGETYHIRERRTGKFSRSLTFPVDVNEEEVNAQYENGLLTLSVPKAEEVKPKRITVNIR